MVKCEFKNCSEKAKYALKGDPVKFCREHKDENMVDVTRKLCEEKYCNTRASYGFEGGKEEYCAKHGKERGMIDVHNKHKICKFEDCTLLSSFGYEGKKAEYCSEHKKINMINVIEKRKCKDENCFKIPTFGLEGKKPEYCFIHKLDNMVDIKSKRCKYENCNKQPQFNISGKEAEYCSKHKQEGMINVNNKKCKFEGCFIQPSFGLEGKKPEYCVIHKLKNMIDVISKKCKQIDCNKRPIFGYKKPEFCKDHKQHDMLDITNKKCKHKGCDKLPTFGINKIEYCKQHKLNNMIDLHNKNKKCNHNDCGKRSTFGLKGDIPKYCSKHKLENMINLRHNMCEFCNTYASYGKLFHPKIHCVKHKQPNEYVKNNPKCIYNNSCKKQPCYTDKIDNYPLRCEDHKNEHDKNVVESECKNCHDLHYIREGNLCNGCSEWFKIKVNKPKETHIKNVLENNNITIYSWDKKINDACLTNQRPDFLLTQESDNFILILEVDENQHKSYKNKSTCDTSRMLNIHQEFGGLPICFIRYNPDTYTDNNGNKIRPSISREKRLINVINNIINDNDIKQKMLTVIYLFYDNDNGQTEKIIEIDIEKETDILLGK